MSTPTSSKSDSKSDSKSESSADTDSKPDSPDEDKAGTKFPDGYPRGRTAHEVPTVDGPEWARGTVEQTSPAAHVDDVAYFAALLRGDSRAPGRDKAAREAEVLGVNYQYASQVRQLLAERANVIAYGNVDRLAGIETALDALGYTGDRSIGASSGPMGRSARSDQSVKTSASGGGSSDSGGSTGSSGSKSSSSTSSTGDTGTGTTSATSPSGGSTAASSKQS
jgi:hypothetical protein